MRSTLLLLLGACAHPAAPVVPTAPASVQPGINDNFLDPEMDVDEWAKRFSAESREVAARQPAVLAAIGLSPGMAVADIGAGSGLYVRPFAEAVGADGKVYAVDISPRFLEHLRAMTSGWPQVEVIEGTETSVELPPASIDVAFVCDTYHHFEFPPQTLASLHAALKPGGRLFVLDFERVEGKSSAFVMGHVRAGREVFTDEIRAAGFTGGDVVDAGLEENYLIRFTR
jgi:ubiquinone/menaquinone biosynthesis C-methylase UbiE